MINMFNADVIELNFLNLIFEGVPNIFVETGVLFTKKIIEIVSNIINDVTLINFTSLLN